MPSHSSPEHLLPGVGFAPILLANLVPLVGVVQFGWDPETLIAIYALEVFLAFPLAATKALFARQPPATERGDPREADVARELAQKRGTLELVPWLPPVYPRAVPSVGYIIPSGLGFSVMVGVVFAGTVPVADVFTRPEVVVSVVALLAAQVGETWHEFLRGGRCETASPASVVETPVRQAFFLLLLLGLIPEGAMDDPTIVLGGLVLGKLVVEWSAFRASNGDGGSIARWLTASDAKGEPTDPPRVPDCDPDARVSTDRTSLLAIATLHTLTRPDRSFVFVVPFVIVGLLAMETVDDVGDPGPAVVVLGLVLFGLFTFLIALKIVEFYLEYGSLEYRRYDDRLVVYDTLVEEPQWAVPLEEVREASVVSHRLPDRLRDTRTISVTAGWGDDETERYVGPVADPDEFVAAFELPVRTTELEPIDRRLATVALTPVVGTVLVVFALVVDQRLSLSQLLFVGLLFPLTLIVPWQIWFLAYPDPE